MVSVVALAAALATGLTGCAKKPGGQVVAVIGSDEVTEQELRTEAEAAGVPANQNFSGYAPAILDRVIQRDLLADYAKDQKLNRGPEFVARRQQIEQALLANLGTQQLLRRLPPPTSSDIAAFIQANPQMFKDRQRLTMDQVRFASPSVPDEIKALTKLGSIGAIMAKLAAQNTPAVRGAATLDTGMIDPAVARQIVALPNGRVFDISNNGTTYISAITGRAPIAVPESAWSAAAGAAFQRERAQKTVSDEIKALRANTKIQFAPGYAPK